MSWTKTYREMRRFDTHEDRLNYLLLHGDVGRETFGFDRYMNQNFYRSREWKQLRNQVIVRDNGWDLGHSDFPIYGKILIHHINPITPEDIKHSTDQLFDLDNLITVSLDTHNAIHYGNPESLPKPYVERRPGDTKLW